MTSVTLPATVAQFKKRLPAFISWLSERGSSVHANTNSYEVARFVTSEGMGVIYCNSADRITSWRNGADVAFLAFLTSSPWKAVAKPKRSSKTKRLYNDLVARDGNGCLYCGKPVSLDEATLEHIVPMSAGGPDHLANLTLAHQACNQAAGSLSAREKFEMAFRQRIT